MDCTFTLPGIQELFPDLDKWRASRSPQPHGTKSQRRIPRLSLTPPAKLSPSSSSSRSQTDWSPCTSEHSEYQSSTDTNDHDIRRDVPIQCTMCDKTFRHASSLTMHRNIHTGVQPFKCPYPQCNKAFNVRSNMYRHARSHNPKGSVDRRPKQNSQLTPVTIKKKTSRSNICSVCSKHFAYPSDLRVHMAIHTDENPFICQFPSCRRSFNVKSNLRRHERLHRQDLQDKKDESMDRLGVLHARPSDGVLHARLPFDAPTVSTRLSSVFHSGHSIRPV
ncbi:hypothetical protein C8J56DRAFT_334413 [Mycena floridula]|nr:hypothetical protein C8J56DRAFT_334413 [Mycena floridula]